MTEGTVCDLCLLVHPEKIELISYKCFYKEEHRDRKRLVSARWSPEEGRLSKVIEGHNAGTGISIRPLPNKSLPRGKKFVLCNPGSGRFCKGEECSFAHSLPERDYWNNKLAERNATRTSQTAVQSSRFLHSEKPSRSTQFNQPRSASAGAYFSPRPSYEEQVTTRQQLEQGQHGNQPGRKRHYTLPEPLVTTDSGGDGVSAEFLSTPLVKLLPNINPSQTYPQSNKAHTHSESTDDEWPSFDSTSPVHHIDHTLETFSSPIPDTSTLGPNMLSQYAQQQPTAAGSTTTATVSAVQSTKVQQGTYHATHQFPGGEYKEKMSINEKPAAPLMYLPLSNENYKPKFRELLKCEENTHGEILKNRCNGTYKLVLHQAGLKRPAWIQQAIPEGQKRFGYLEGLNGDQIAYTVQAAQDRDGVIITHRGTGNEICKASILPENYSSTVEKFHIAFDDRNHNLLQKSVYQVSRGTFNVEVDVKFELKHSYFNNLQRSIKRLNIKIVNRLMPDEKSFNFELPASEDFHHYAQSCSPDQLEALKAIASCPCAGPPVLVTGPFGTGKTYTLANAADYIFRTSISTKRPARVLVCTQQRASADNFFECYQKLETPKLKGYVETCIIRDYGFHNPNHRHLYKSAKDFEKSYIRNSRRNTTRYLLVTTCLTAPHLANCLEQDFFTHIFIDEGAQMREPEAVAPLCLANENTKIVIAGDQYQVGPAMLVLGQEAQNNGLAVSLLERLYQLYKTLGEVAKHHHVTLVTNYRCHKEIFSLSGGLFYETLLRLPGNTPPPSAHPQYPYPLVFVCSSVDDKVKRVDSNTNEEEIAVIISTIEGIVRPWPPQWEDPDLGKLCIMSPNRSQLTLASNRISKINKRLKQVRRLPTYDMQGKEFRALFLSTSEPTEDDSYSRNPTKSFCDPFVFNTAITRAQSLVVAVGNPFLLLKTEEVMVVRYGEKGKCWSSFLRACLRNYTLLFGNNLHLSDVWRRTYISKLQELVKGKDEVMVQDQVQAVLPKKELFAAHDFPTLESTLTAQQVFVSSHQQRPTQGLPQVSEAQPISKLVSSIDEGLQQPVTTSSSAETSSSPENTISHLSIATEEPTKRERGTTEAGNTSYFNFENEYENLGQLGKGGFGVVYHVRNKLALRDFALKVIKLKTNEEKMYKEVRALASLVHPHIVIFHHAWIERAPENWTENQHWSALQSSQYLPSSVPFENGASDSSAHETPTSADTPSDTTEQSVGAATAVKSNESDSFTVEFRDSNSSKTKVDVTEDATVKVKLDNLQTGISEVVVHQPRPLEIERPLCLFIQTELCEKDTLRDWMLNNTANRKRKTVLKFFESILDALIYIHKKGLVHRDLKPSNIFFARTGTDDTEPDTEPLIKIGDFGLVTGTIAPDPAALTVSGESKQQSQSSSGYQAGTFFYMSPEQRTSRKCDQKTDIYAFGIIFFELNCPFKTDSERIKVLHSVRENGIPESFVHSDNVPTAITDIIKLLLEHDPARRPSAADLVKNLHDNQTLRRLKKNAKKKLVLVLDLKL